MRTDELVRALEARAERREPDGADRVVAAARRAAVRRHRAERAAVGGVAVLVLGIVGVAGWHALDDSDDAVRVVTPADDESPTGPVDGASDEEHRRQLESRSEAREQQRRHVARQEVARRADQAGAHDWPMVEHNGIGLRVPEGWYTSGENLTPDVVPHPVASFGTAPLAAGGGARCSQYPIAAVLAMDDTDVLVSLLERAGLEEPERDVSLWDQVSDATDAEIVDCPDWPTGFEARWHAFVDKGRGFHLLVVTGPSVSEERLLELAAAVDAIYVEPAGTQWSSADPRSWRLDILAQGDTRVPRPLPRTGAIGHAIELDGRRFLVGSITDGSDRAVEMMDADHDGTTTSLCAGCPWHVSLTGSLASWRGGAASVAPAGAWGVVQVPASRAEFILDGRVYRSSVVALPSDPEIGVWAVFDPDGFDVRVGDEVETRLLGADGREID